MHKILVVDDHLDIRKLMRITLDKEYLVIEAENGDSALDIIRHERPDLVLLDIMMPGKLDGLAVLEAVKGNPELNGTCVVMLTARGQVKDYEAGMLRGADGYFIKPFSPLQLLGFIRKRLG